ncbi:MAG: phosphoenolpyruvate--protein phosphotransferase, partial [Elusimicrobiota bacterium]
GSGQFTLKDIQSRVILVSHALHPSDAVEVKKENVIGFTTDVGGRTSHIVIMAESLQIPAVVGLKNVSRKVSPGDLLIVDGDEGVVYINPESEIIRKYRSKKQRQEQTKKKLVKLKNRPAIMRCGRKIEVSANIESATEASTAVEYGAEGIGLFRTEYMYLNRKDLPSEQEIYEKIVQAANIISPNNLVVRTIDLGADKLSRQLGIKAEKSTFLGMRGIRICLAFPELFKTQLRAILRASAEANIFIMYPMITGVDEIKAANEIVERVREELVRDNVKVAKDIKIGSMIETPAAALDIKHICEVVDFLSIGTNDLIQYTLAVDRILESVSYLYNPADISIIKMIKSIADAGRESGKWVSVCGEMASDNLYTELLIGLGIEKLSMSALSIPKIKQLVIKTDFQRCRELASKALSMYRPDDITKLLKSSRDELLTGKEGSL